VKVEIERLPDERVKVNGVIEKTVESDAYTGYLELVLDAKEYRNTMDFKVSVNNTLNYHMSHSQSNMGERSMMTLRFGKLFRGLDELTLERSFKIDDKTLEIFMVKSINGEKIRETSELYRGSIDGKGGSKVLLDTSDLERVESDVKEFTSEVSSFYIDPMMVDMTDAMIEEFTKVVQGTGGELLDKESCQQDCAWELLKDTWACLKKGDIFGPCQENAGRVYDHCLSLC